MNTFLLTCLLLIGMINISIGAPPDPIVHQDMSDFVLTENESFIDVDSTRIVIIADYDLESFPCLFQAFIIPEPVFDNGVEAKTRSVKKINKYRHTPDHFY